MATYLPLLISVGKDGCYSSSMTYDRPFDTLLKYNLYIKHVPFTVMSKVKNIITQTWKDEDGDDVFIPENIVHEAYDLELEFVYWDPTDSANAMIRQFIDEIKGKWLKVYDSYTKMGRQGVYVISADDDPRFLRREGRDCLVFNVKFRVNDPNTNIVL